MLSFICLGPQRTASSWLDRMLRQHEGIGLPRLVKETFFWDQRYEKGADWYYSHFTNSHSQVLGEIAPTCFDDPKARRRIIANNPNLKVIICLRDPIERTYSLFCHYYATGRLKGSFSEALEQNIRLIESSNYSKYVDLWGKSVGKENILIMTQEGVNKEPIGVLNDICNFIGITPIQWNGAEHKYGQRPMPRSILITNFLTRFGRISRYFGVHAIPETAKNLGLKKLFYEGGSNQYPPIFKADYSMLLDKFSIEYKWIDKLPSSRTFVLSDI